MIIIILDVITITAHSCWTPTRPHANPVDTEIHSAASERGGIDSTCGDQMGLASDRRLPAEGRQNEWNVCKQWTAPLRKRNRESTCCEKNRKLTHTGQSGSTANCSKVLQPTSHIQERRRTEATVGIASQTGF